MGLSLVTAPTSEPVSIYEAAVDLRITDSPMSDADYVADLITAARQHIETLTRRALLAQTWDYTLDCFPEWQLELPIQPVQSISWVRYVNGSGNTVSFSTGASPDVPKYDVFTDRPKTVLTPKYGLEWPDTRDQLNAVTVRFVAGYTTVPADLLKALRYLVVHWYEQREPIVYGQSTAPEVPFTVESLLSPYMIRGF